MARENVNQRGEKLRPEDWEDLQKILPTDGIRREERMADHTTFRVGGPAECFLLPKNETELSAVCHLLRERDIPYLTIGNGSNLLVGSLGIPGAVVSTMGLKGIRTEGETIHAMSGEYLHSLSGAAEEAGLTGLEFASGIPGSVGGAVYMNAGAYGGEIRGILESARILTAEGEIVTRKAEDLSLSYRHSALMDHPGEIVVSADFHLRPGDPESIAAVAADYNARRREKQPLQYPSAGSTFQRPKGHFAGQLIEEAGLRGFSVGGASVSEKHAGFIINRGNATPEDIRKLIGIVRDRVLENSGVILEPEVRIVGAFREGEDDGQHSSSRE